MYKIIQIFLLKKILLPNVLLLLLFVSCLLKLKLLVFFQIKEPIEFYFLYIGSWKQ